MRKKTPIFLCLWLLAFSAVAQIYVGPIAGPNYSWISYDDKDLKDVYDVKPVIGFHAGVAFSFKVRERFFLTTSFLYNTKGKVVTKETDDVFKNSVTYNYITVPVLYTVDFKSTFGSNKVFKWYFGAGPNINYWLGGKGSFISSETAELDSKPIEYKIVFYKDQEEVGDDEMGVKDPNRMQLGINFATGFAFEPSANQKLLLLLRYELGHSFFSRTTDGVFSSTFYEDEMRIRTQGLRISVSYMIDLNIQERKKGKSTIKKKRL